MKEKAFLCILIGSIINATIILMFMNNVNERIVILQIKTFDRTLIKILFVIASSIFVNEYIFRVTVFSVLKWSINNPFLLIMNMALLSVLTGMVFFLTRRIDWSLCFIVFSTISIAIVNMNKLSLRSVPVTFEDLFLIREVWVLLPELLTIQSFIALFLVFPFFFMINFTFKKWIGDITFHDLKKTVLNLMIVSIAFLTLGQVAYTNDLDAWETGVIYSLSNGLRKPPVIDTEMVQGVQEKLLEEINSFERDSVLNSTGHLNEKIKPNIVVIMSEAFWDINQLDVELSRNPISFFDQLKKESISGELIVPVFGGGTANTEYEVLTGMTLKNYPWDWHVVYRESMDEPTPSLASILSEYGYETIALHPYYPWYYRRDEVYPMLGFHQFISIENMEDAQQIGPFVSDAYVTDLIIDLIEDNEKPIFNFTVTMQNHGPYHNERFADDSEEKINVLTPINDEASDLLACYAQGLYYSDLELKRLIDYLSVWDEPTLLVFFGDHLPMLGEDFLVYREAGFIGDESADVLKDEVKMMSVPYLVWANYPIDLESKEPMNASFLTPLILKTAGFPAPDYLNLVELLSHQAPVILRKGFWDDEYNFYDASTEEYALVRALYNAIQEMNKESEEK